ncbi:MAG TPA: PDZ domain-containing protein [Pyrinomonadaceae bacterium]|jgi:predicted metalloprotease with PDZ domain
MRHFRTPALVLAFVWTLSLISLTEAQTNNRRTNTTNAAAPDIAYTVSMPEPHTHMLEVEMRVRSAAANARSQVNLVMPVWTPGSYLVREYARHVQDFAAKDASGRALAWSKVNKNTWRIEAGGEREVRATYRVYANELTVRTNELNDRHAFWNNAALLMYVDGQLAAPSTVRVTPPRDNWKIATGLPSVAGERNTFRAENFDILYDSPFIVSNFKTLDFEVRGIPHRIVIDGEGNYDAERIRRDTQKIVEASVALMGDLPYRNYTFILMTHPTAGGGLEHLNSTALIWRRFNFRTDADHTDFLTLVAHEFFHLWNVKRIRPDALGPFDYTQENYTRLLWVAEGITSYYENILTRRAGLMTDKDFLSRLARSFQSLQNTPGRLEMSVEEASFDAWIEYYRPDEQTVNSAISYYDKGAILGALLDLEIRRRSNGARSLDDVMRYLYTEFAGKNRNYTPEDFQRAAEIAAGASLDDFFRRYVRGREELDYNTALAVAGLRLETVAGDAAKPAPQKAYFGATLTNAGEYVALSSNPSSGVVRASLSPDAVVVKAVPFGTPAYNQGLNVGDQILAIDGIRVTRDNLNARLEERRPGDTVRLTVFRLDELRTFDIKLGARIDPNFRILPITQPTAEQMKTYTDWLAAPFPKAAT